MATVTTTPALVVPNRQAQVFVSPTAVGANYVRYYITGAPAGTKWATQLKASAATFPRIKVHEGPGGSNDPWNITFEAGGEYKILVDEYTKNGTTFSGGYQGDTRGSQTETLVFETAVYVYVGQRSTITIGTGADTAKLVFWVFGDSGTAPSAGSLHATTLALHGEQTPTISNPSSQKAATAAIRANVTTALAALVPGSPLTASTALGSISSIVSDFVAKFNAHISNTGGAFHAAADADNPLKKELAASPTPQSLTAFVTQALRSLRQHETNDKGQGIGSAAAAYHQSGGNPTSDMLNQALTAGVSDVASAYEALADLWRAYEAHRVNAAVHAAADNTNSLTALSKILDVNRYFLAELAAISPSAAPGDSSGMALLKNWGFKEG